MVIINPGSKYKETKERLREKIRDNTINSLESKAISHECYFCEKNIKGKMWILIENPTKNKYVDDKCYQNSKLFRYYKEFPVSMN